MIKIISKHKHANDSLEDGFYTNITDYCTNEDSNGVYANIQLRLFTISNAYCIDASIVSKKYHDEYNFSLTNKSVFYLKNIQNGLIKKLQQSETANEKLSDKQSLSLIGDGDLKGFINELFCSKVFDELLNDIFKNMGL